MGVVVVVVDACHFMALLFDLVLVLTVCDARWLSVILLLMMRMRMIILLSFFSYSNKMILIILNCWYKVVWRLLVYPCGFSYTSLQMKAERPTGKT